jgi:hypothetical protein
LAAIDNFTAVPTIFIDGGDHVVVLGRYGGTMKNGGATLDSPFCHVYRFHGDKRHVPAVHRHGTVGAVDGIAESAWGRRVNRHLHTSRREAVTSGSAG